MVFADRLKADVLDKDHLIVFLREGLAEQLARIPVQAGEDLGIHARDARRRLAQPLTLRVFADSQENLAYRGLDAGMIDSRGARPVLGREFGPARASGGFLHEAPSSLGQRRAGSTALGRVR